MLSSRTSTAEAGRAGRRALSFLKGAGKVVVVLAPAAFAAVLVTAYPFGADQGIYATVADGIREGLAPYRDIFDLKPPGIYYVYAGAFAVGGRQPASVHWFYVIAVGGAALAAWRLGDQLHRGGVTGAALLGFTLLAALCFWNIDQPDGFACFPITAAFALAVGDGERGRLRLAGAGFLLGVAFWLKYTAALAIVGIWLYGAESGNRLRTCVRNALWSGFGFAATVIAGILYFAAAGILAAFWAFNIKILPRYSVMPGEMPLGGFISVFLWPPVRSLIQLIPFIVVPGFIGVVIFFVRRLRGRWALAGWLAASGVGILAQRRYYLYHWAVAFPPLAVFAGVGWSQIVRWLRGRRYAVIGAVGIVASVAPAFSVYKNYVGRYVARWALITNNEHGKERFNRYFRLEAFDAAAARATGEYINVNSRPGDRIYVWGIDGTPYFHAARLPAPGYAANYPAATWFPAPARAKFIADFIAAPPRYVVVPRGQVVYPILGTMDGPAALMEKMPELYRFFIARYVATAAFGPYVIYVTS